MNGWDNSDDDDNDDHLIKEWNKSDWESVCDVEHTGDSETE